MDIKVICVGGPERWCFPMHGLAADVIDKLDAAASKRGLSRNSYIVEVLAQQQRTAQHRNIDSCSTLRSSTDTPG